MNEIRLVEVNIKDVTWNEFMEGIIYLKFDNTSKIIICNQHVDINVTDLPKITFYKLQEEE